MPSADFTLRIIAVRMNSKDTMAARREESKFKANNVKTITSFSCLFEKNKGNNNKKKTITVEITNKQFCGHRQINYEYL